MPETQKPGTTEATPPTTDASPNRMSQIRSTSKEVDEDVDYGDGLDDSEDVQVFKDQGQPPTFEDLDGSRANEREKVYSSNSSDPYGVL